MWFHKNLGVWLLSLLRRPFSMDLLEVAPAFDRCLELGGFTFRGTDLLALVENQSLPYSSSIVERLSLFVRVHLGRFTVYWRLKRPHNANLEQ